MPQTLPALPYAFDALEPHIDAATMQIHHGKHHQAYVNNLNAALDKHSALHEKPLESILADLNSVPDDVRGAVRNNGGGHWNHTFFWKLLKKDGGNPTGAVAEAINTAFGSYENFKTQFTQAATTRFGSGWAWLCKMEDGSLQICSTPNQDNPYMKVAAEQGKPVLALDVWEHAYYLKYQNKRADYISNWWNVVNWEKADAIYIH